MSTTTSTDQGFTVSLGSKTLTEAEIRAALTDSAYATLGAGDYAVQLVRGLPARLEKARAEGPTRAQELAKDLPTRARTFAQEAPERVSTELRKELEGYTTRGRKVVDTISSSEQTKRAKDQTETARSQVRGAVTSLRKAVDASTEAVEDAAGRLGLRRSA